MDQSVYIKFDDVEMKSWEIIKCHTCAAVKLRKKNSLSNSSSKQMIKARLVLGDFVF